MNACNPESMNPYTGGCPGGKSIQEGMKKSLRLSCEYAI